MKRFFQQHGAFLFRGVGGCICLVLLGLSACSGDVQLPAAPTAAVTALARVTASPLPDLSTPVLRPTATPRATSPSAPSPEPGIPTATDTATAPPPATATVTLTPTTTPEPQTLTPLPAIPSATPVSGTAVPPPADVESWRGTFYANVGLEGQPVLVRQEAAINYHWGTAAPVNGVPRDGFSARWTRRVTFDGGQYIFYARSSDGVRVYINDVAIVDDWSSGRPALHSVPIGLQSGTYDLRVEHFTAAGSAELQVWWESVAIADWTGTYYANPDLREPATLVRSDKAPVFDWQTFAPDRTLPIDNFSVRWLDTVFFEQGLYRFSATADDGLRLYVDGLRALDLWRDGGVSGEAVLWLPDGEHRVLVEYYERRQRAAVAVSWTRLEFEATLWLGAYYANPDLLGVPVRFSDDGAPDFDWGLDAPGQEVPADRFSARWTRELSFEEGIWQFRAVSSGGVRLFAGDQLVVDGWQAEGGATEHVGNAIISGQQLVTIEYFDPGGVAQLSVEWTWLGPLPK